MEQATSLLYDLDGFTVAGVTVNPLGSGCWSWSVCRCRAARTAGRSPTGCTPGG